MVRKYIFGEPFETEAVIKEIPCERGLPAYGKTEAGEGFAFTYEMSPADAVYGLGENVRGINKRGFIYRSYCADDGYHTEEKSSLYGAHNFLVVSGRETFGIFVDYPGEVVFDVGFTDPSVLEIRCPRADLYFYVIDGKTPYEIAREFRSIIGRSYIPPKFAFGFGQSRWGYKTQADFREVVKNYRDNCIPLDMVYMDIDYMERYKDFTTNKENFPDFAAFVVEMKSEGVRVIPIIDAGVKVEKGYDVYDDGVKKGYFCKREDGSEFVAEVWPGHAVFPDVLNPEARKWFGGQYEKLISMGVEGFWNDMNEPSIFSTPEDMAKVKKDAEVLLKKKDALVSDLGKTVFRIHNDPENYKLFYHNANGRKVRHDLVHNLYGYNMTRAAGEAFEKIAPEKRILLFSRSSYIGMHRYGGIWTGDNRSWWSHILLNLQMLPSLNMCGFLYVGADIGGFGDDTTRDLLLRWLALGVFTPLMRNHSCVDSRRQECYNFGDVTDFRSVIGVRYRLIPYLYSEYMKAATEGDLMFRPLAFDYTDDEFAPQVEDQLLLGHEVMIAPVYTQNATGRYVYLPEEMMFVKFSPSGITEEILPKGHHYVNVALNEVPMFIRKGKAVPLARQAETTDELDWKNLSTLGYDGADYRLYED